MGGTFVTVGNATQPFQRLLDAVASLQTTLPQPVTVQYGVGTYFHENATKNNFVKMDSFLRYVTESELLIMHAGAGSVIHALQAGKVPVVMPRRKSRGELIDDHQLEFAEALDAAGKVVVARITENLEGAIQCALNLQRTSIKPTGGTRLVPRIAELLLEVKKDRRF